MLSYKQARPSISTRIDPNLKEVIDEAAKGFDFLSSSRLSFRDIGDDEVYYFSIVVNQRIERLNLYSNRVTMVEISYLLRARLQSLRFVNLGGNLIGNLGVRMLTRCQWTKLQELELGCCQLYGPGLVHLEKGRWPNLEFISLAYNRVGSAVGRLVRGNWKKIQRLSLCKSKNNQVQGKLLIEEGMKLILGRWKILQDINITLKDYKTDSSEKTRRISIYLKFCVTEKIKQAVTAKFSKMKYIKIQHG